MKTILRAIVAGSVLISMSACSSWDSLSRQQKDTAVGAAVGGVVGGAASDGSALGTIGGAAAGGLIGNEVGKRR